MRTHDMENAQPGLGLCKMWQDGETFIARTTEKAGQTKFWIAKGQSDGPKGGQLVDWQECEQAMFEQAVSLMPPLCDADLSHALDKAAEGLTLRQPLPAKDRYSKWFPIPADKLHPIEAKYQNLCQIRQLGEWFASNAESEGPVTAWLMLNPAVVDRLCAAYGLTAKGGVSAGIRALVAAGKRLFENVPGY